MQLKNKILWRCKMWFCNFKIEDKNKNCDHFATALKGSRLQCQVLMFRLMQLICLLKSLKYFILYLLRFFILHLLLIPGGCNWLENAVRSWLQISNRISQYQMSHLKTKAISCRLVFFWTGYHKWRIFVERSTHFYFFKAVGIICRNVWDWVAAGPIINSGPPP